MASTHNEKELRTDWPFEEGLEAETTSQTGRVMNLVPENSVVPRRYKCGLQN